MYIWDYFIIHIKKVATKFLMELLEIWHQKKEYNTCYGLD